MLKIIKKSLIILLLITIDTIVFIAKSIYQFYNKSKENVRKIIKSFHGALKEELTKWVGNQWEINIIMMS